MQILSPTGWKYFKNVNSLAMSRCGLEMKHPFDLSFVNNGMVLKKAFRQHTQYCLQNCPPEKLLVYDVRQGWEPLCEFLGKKVPDKPFPRENVAGSIVAKAMATRPSLIQMQREMKFTIGFLSLGLLLAFYQIQKSNFGGTFKMMCSKFWNFMGFKMFSHLCKSS